MATFMASMYRAFKYVGGVPAEVIFDNAKTVVSERVGTVVRFNENLLRMALAFNFTPKACWTNDPESKGKIESNVKYVKRGFFYGREYRDLDDLNAQALNWCNNVANAKVHNTTHAIPWDRLVEELPHLQSLPQLDGALYVLESRQATKTSLISIDGVKYSVPAQFANRKVNYRRYENKIEVLMGDGHPLQVRFETMAPEAAEYLDGLSRKRVGHLKDQMEKIVRLAADYDHDEISRAMARALAYGSFGYASLKRILERQRQNPDSLPRISRKPAISMQLIHNIDVVRRDLAYYERWAQ